MTECQKLRAIDAGAFGVDGYLTEGGTLIFVAPSAAVLDAFRAKYVWATEEHSVYLGLKDALIGYGSLTHALNGSYHRSKKPAEAPPKAPASYVGYSVFGSGLILPRFVFMPIDATLKQREEALARTVEAKVGDTVKYSALGSKTLPTEFTIVGDGHTYHVGGQYYGSAWMGSFSFTSTATDMATFHKDFARAVKEKRPAVPSASVSTMASGTPLGKPNTVFTFPV